MSPLPERRKTPEELAELRESLGIPAASPGNPPPSPAPEETPPEESASKPPATEKYRPRPGEPAPGVPEKVATSSRPESAESPSEDAEAKDSDPLEVVRVRPRGAPTSLRKSAGLVVDRPKGQTARGEPGVLPTRRRSERELMELRRRAGGPPAPTAVVANKLAAPLTLLIFYGAAVLGLTAGGLGILVAAVEPMRLPFDFLRRWAGSDAFPVGLFAVFAVAAGIMLACAAWLAVFRPLSRHHAGFLTILALLTLVFSALHCFF